MNSETNFVNNPLIDRIRELERQISSINNARQPLVFDWIELSPSIFTYISASEISLNNESYMPLFQVGYRLRLKQGGDWKYFFVIKISSNVLTIFAGTSYTFTSSTITEIGLSSLDNPTGLPGLFSYLPLVKSNTTSPGTNMTLSNIDCKFRMDGSTILVSNTFLFTPLGFEALYSMSVPIAPEGSTISKGGGRPPFTYFEQTGPGLFGGGIISNVSFVYPGHVDLARDDNTAWGTGNLTMYPYFTYSYTP